MSSRKESLIFLHVVSVCQFDAQAFFTVFLISYLIFLYTCSLFSIPILYQVQERKLFMIFCKYFLLFSKHWLIAVPTLKTQTKPNSPRLWPILVFSNLLFNNLRCPWNLVRLRYIMISSDTFVIFTCRLKKGNLCNFTLVNRTLIHLTNNKIKTSSVST